MQQIGHDLHQGRNARTELKIRPQTHWTAPHADSAAILTDICVLLSSFWKNELLELSNGKSLSKGVYKERPSQKTITCSRQAENTVGPDTNAHIYTAEN